MGAAYLGPVARYLGLLAMTIGEDERALGHLETARSAAERMGARPTVVLTALDAAEVLARRGAPGDAQRGAALVQRVAQERRAAGDGRRGRARRRTCARAWRTPPRAGAARRRRGRVRAALRREQDVWLLDYDGRSVCLQDAKGLHHLATLLRAARARRSPRVALAASRRRGASARRRRSPPTARGRSELREELAEAQAFNDPERVARARRAARALAADVERADDATSAAGERARSTSRARSRRRCAGSPSTSPSSATCCAARSAPARRARYQPDPGMPLDVGGRALAVRCAARVAERPYATR